MTKKQKLIQKILTANASITWNELSALLVQLGYQQIEGEGSRVKFDNGNPDDLVLLHKPHPQKEVKKYALKQVISFLKQKNML